MTDTLVPLFSTPLYISEDSDTMPDIMPELASSGIVRGGWDNTLPNSFRSIELVHSNGGSQSVDNNILDRFPELKQWVMKHVNIYCFDIMEIDSDTHTVDIVCSWLNVHPQFARAPRHTHRNSCYSGVFYIKTFDGCGELIFERSDHQILCPTYAHQNVYNSSSWTITPKNGTMVMFPSSVMHYVQPNEIIDERVSVAFNVIVRGEFGNPTSFLKIQ